MFFPATLAFPGPFSFVAIGNRRTDYWWLPDLFCSVASRSWLWKAEKCDFSSLQQAYSKIYLYTQSGAVQGRPALENNFAGREEWPGGRSGSARHPGAEPCACSMR